ncbi:ABC transporter permease [Elizabethkingia anophelis]|uniref:hypothetical protein n=1 Tax=Elizabethkingia anophelis TaxID=1117645 RepID=UPI00099A4A65|nr:hypothetical protein [Elizabethkingia anophelis]MCT4013666.1 ABC transporter permease [Elizabethkingia anophelis]MDV3897930.1 ABC transporter permease [Elizabethkingia anophelis]OPC55323.1 hypothetical protein BAY06_00065 [Elizabethkingia anophelis]
MIIDKLLDSLEIDKQEFYIQFSSHPNYPSALAFCDTLNFMGIRNMSYSLEKDFWDELPVEFITIYKNNFALIKKKGKVYKIFSKSISIATKFELLQESTNFVSVFERNEAGKSQKIKSYLLFFVFLLCFYLGYNLWMFPWFYILYNMFSLLGLCVCVGIFRKKHSNIPFVVNNFLTYGESGDDISCSILIRKYRFDIFGLKFSDFCLIYFIFISVLGVFFFQTSFFLELFSLIFFFIIFSLTIIQFLLEKKIYKIYIVIILTLFFQILLSLLYFNGMFSFKNAMLSILLFVIVFILVAFVNEKTIENNELRMLNVKIMRFKKNYDIFKRELINNDKIIFENRGPLFFGDNNSIIQISIVFNLFSIHCKKAYRVLEKLLNNYSGFAIELRFNCNETDDNQHLKDVINLFFSIYNNLGQAECLKALEFWFKHMNYEELKNKYKINYIEDSIEYINKIDQENKNKKINFAPIFFINGYKLPDQYDYDDIFYFIEELIEDEDFYIFS